MHSGYGSKAYLSPTMSWTLSIDKMISLLTESIVNESTRTHSPILSDSTWKGGREQHDTHSGVGLACNPSAVPGVKLSTMEVLLVGALSSKPSKNWTPDNCGPDETKPSRSLY